MADIASQLSSWTFDKPAVVVAATHAQRSASAASSPNLCDDAPDTLRLDTAAAQAVSRKEAALFHDRYNSSEEDLTTGGSDSGPEFDDDGDDQRDHNDNDDDEDEEDDDDDDDDDDVVEIHDPVNQPQPTSTLSVSRWNKGRSGDMAVTVSYAFAGRPKVVEDCRSPLDRPMAQLRSASLATVPTPPMHTLHAAGKAQRQSMTLNAMSRLASSSSTPRPGSPLAAERQRVSTVARPASPPASERQRVSTVARPASPPASERQRVSTVARPASPPTPKRQRPSPARPASPPAPERQRSSTIACPASPPTSEPRWPSTSYSPATKELTIPPPPTAAPPAPPAPIPSRTTASNRCPSPAWSEAARSTSAVHAISSSRVSAQSQLDLTRIQTTQTTLTTFSRQSYLPPDSPALSFLSSDPYENTSIDASAPTTKKPTGHRRLRSISFKLALAKIAITPAKKSTDSRSSHRIATTPLTPATPQTAPVDRPASFAAPAKLRRASTVLRPKSRQGESARHSTQPAPPPVPQASTAMMPPRPSRMVARGANEIEPTLVLPDFHSTDDDDAIVRAKGKAVRKRKSLMDFMDSLA